MCVDKGSTITVTNNFDIFYLNQNVKYGISPHWDTWTVTTCHDEGSKVGKPFYVLWTCIM